MAEVSVDHSSLVSGVEAEHIGTIRGCGGNPARSLRPRDRFWFVDFHFPAVLTARFTFVPRRGVDSPPPTTAPAAAAGSCNGWATVPLRGRGPRTRVEIATEPLVRHEHCSLTPELRRHLYDAWTRLGRRTRATTSPAIRSPSSASSCRLAHVPDRRGNPCEIMYLCCVYSSCTACAETASTPLPISKMLQCRDSKSETDRAMWDSPTMPSGSSSPPLRQRPDLSVPAHRRRRHARSGEQVDDFLGSTAGAPRELPTSTSRRGTRTRRRRSDRSATSSAWTSATTSTSPSNRRTTSARRRSTTPARSCRASHSARSTSCWRSTASPTSRGGTRNTTTTRPARFDPMRGARLRGGGRRSDNLRRLAVPVLPELGGSVGTKHGRTCSRSQRSHSTTTIPGAAATSPRCRKVPTRSKIPYYRDLGSKSTTSTA